MLLPAIFAEAWLALSGDGGFSGFMGGGGGGGGLGASGMVLDPSCAAVVRLGFVSCVAFVLLGFLCLAEPLICWASFELGYARF